MIKKISEVGTQVIYVFPKAIPLLSIAIRKSHKSIAANVRSQITFQSYS